jgi:hypothetical protein
MNTIRFDFPKLPVSVNKLFAVSRGRKILTSAGRDYKTAFVASRGGVDPIEFMQFEADPEGYYDLHIWCFLPYGDIYNAGFGKSKNTKYPFKKLDVSNYIKLAEDCIAGLAGVDDRNNWSVHAHKREAHDGHHRLVAILQPLDIEEDPYGLPR